MKDFWLAFLGLGVVLLLVAAVIWMMRYINSASLGVVVREVSPGIECAIATTTDGVAIDCWEAR